ncbi:stage V sporulation protein B [Alicyclobacillus cellulosilyticus]|uniref:Stage V sporulation protein B n=1 Tax=Alicyclobacillus cellulosilyticus TaxID=1003997 RepID=A0A917KD23_9BACL|nr:polysaccharide biosynthesis protein [Alicyclobacillus cellulosilyticus]GGJ08913.1 stage V sporulation protein B [Alicyclobacillus cellulosilyticus]
MADARGFVRGAVLLASAAAVSKLLGSVYTIVLQNVIGDRGMGLFQMAYPVYATLVAVATAGLPVALSKMVSERLALGDVYGGERVFRVALVMLLACGVAAFALLFFGAGMWARLAGDPAAALAVRAVAPALLLVPAMSALRGYYQGYQWMEPTAASQVVEQFVRVATILLLAMGLLSLGYSTPVAAAGAAFGAVTGAAAGLLWLLRCWGSRPRPAAAKRADAPGWLAMSRQLVYYAFPISLGALVVPLMNNIDVITVVNLLKAAGHAQAEATTTFGLLSGRAAKLMMLPTTLASSIGMAVMPAVSEAFTLGYRSQLSGRIDTALRLTVMLALPASAGLAILARPIDITLFRDDAGWDLIAVTAVATVFAGVQLTTAAVLQGAGWVYVPVANLFFACAVKLAANLAWVKMYGAVGAAWATVVCYAVAAALNLWCLRRGLGERIRWQAWFGKPLLATFIMSAVAYAMLRQWMWWGGAGAPRWAVAGSTAAMVVIAAGVYGLALLATGTMTEKELAALPRIGPRLAAWCARLGLVR